MTDELPELPEYRVPVDCPQLLGRNAECIVQGRAMIPHDGKAGATVWLRGHDFVERSGRTLRFRSRHVGIPGGAIEFGGLGRDAWFDVTCPDESTAAALVALMFAPLSWWLLPHDG